MRLGSNIFVLLCFSLIGSTPLKGIVFYDVGRIEINGIQLFQDSKNANEYYYLPPYPRISMSDDESFEFLCLKYVGDSEENSGGLFHALIQFALTSEELELTQAALKEKYPKAIIRGPVQMQENTETNNPSFKILSSILNGNSDFLESEIIASGSAPFFPGSKAGVSALLNTKAATLLWSSFEGVTSDVSIVVEGFFPALVTGFSGSVHADLEMVYDHFSSFQNTQAGFQRTQLNNVVDSLVQSGAIKVDVADMSSVIGADNKMYADLLKIITDRVTNILFDTQSGWSKMPPQEKPIQPSELKERFKNGVVNGFLFGHGLQPYIPDNQFLLKEKKMIRNFSFHMSLNQSSAIKVPVYSAGNLGGFHEEHFANSKYFKVVDMDDPTFQDRDIYFQVNGAFVDCFTSMIDNVSVLVEKSYQDTSLHTFHKSIHINQTSIDSGSFIKNVRYKRLNEESQQWLTYKYKVAWTLDNQDTILVTDWITTDNSSVSIAPPFARKELTIDLDREELASKGFHSARIRFGIKVAGNSEVSKMKVLRKGDSLSIDTVILYHDQDQPIVYQVNWYGSGKELKEELKLLEDDYLFLIPPATE